MFYSLEPEVAGGFGKNTVIDTSIHPPLIESLHYEMDGWLGDELLESFPCFIVTDCLREIIEKSAKTGYKFDFVEVTTSTEFGDTNLDHKIPKFWWLKVIGKAGKDDFGVSRDGCLVVSEQTFKAMKKNSQLKNCDICEY